MPEDVLSMQEEPQPEVRQIEQPDEFDALFQDFDVFGQYVHDEGEATQIAPQAPATPQPPAPQEPTPQQQDDLSSWKPVIDYMQANPAAVQMLSQFIANGGQMPQQAVQPGQPPAAPAPEPEPEVKEWVEPSVPDYFDSFEAKNDPNSESAKWLRKRDKDYADLVQHNTKVMHQFYSTIKEERERSIREAQIRQAQSQRMAQMQRILHEQYQMPEEQMSEFWTFTQQMPINLENMVKLFRATRQEAQAPTQPQAPQQRRAPSLEDLLNATPPNAQGVRQQGQVDGARFTQDLINFNA